MKIDIDEFISKTKTVMTIKDPLGENDMKCNCVYADDAFAEIFREVQNESNNSKRNI